MKTIPESGGGVRRVVFRNAGMRAVGTTDSFKINNQILSGNTINGNPFIFTLNNDGEDGPMNFPPASVPAIFCYVTVTDVSVDGIKGKNCRNMILIDGNKDQQKYHNNFVSLF